MDINTKLTLIIFACLAAFFSSTISFSLFQWDTPVTTVSGTQITRGDLFDMIKLLSGASFLVAFVMLIRKNRKKGGI